MSEGGKGETRLGVGSALRAFQALGADYVGFAFKTSTSFVRVHFPDGREIDGKGPDVADAALDVLRELGKTGTITSLHAASRALVTLDDGATGRLVWVDKRRVMAKVLIGGTHRAIPLGCLKLVEIPIPPLPDEVK